MAKKNKKDEKDYVEREEESLLGNLRGKRLPADHEEQPQPSTGWVLSSVTDLNANISANIQDILTKSVLLPFLTPYKAFAQKLCPWI